MTRRKKLAAADGQILEATARSGRAEHRQVVRARIVLAAADGQSNTLIDQGVHDRKEKPMTSVFGAVSTEVAA